MVRMFDAWLLPGDVSAAPGEVIKIGPDGIAVALRGGTLTIKRMRADGGKIAAAELAQQLGLQVGSRLG
jgi:hypothetical protein